MHCPKCGAQIEEKLCNSCGMGSPPEANFCMHCGARFQVVEEEEAMEDRILCPDGNCTGIIENGRCTVCGRPYEGE